MTPSGNEDGTLCSETSTASVTGTNLQKLTGINDIRWLNNATISITGVAGRYPESDSLEEFWDKLMRGVPLFSCDDRRWPVDFLNLPKNQGKLKDISKFDGEFFGLQDFGTNYIDPQMRLLHEVIFEAIVDAGINPADLRGTKTGVYLGMCYNDTHAALLNDDVNLQHCYNYTSSFITQAFDFHGPSMIIDTACASSLSCLHQAICAVKSGDADRAIVAGLAIHLRPGVSYAFHSLRMLSDDGRSKCLDASADGYCRSEGIVAVLIERTPDAKRIYATIYNSGTNCDGYKQEGITFPKKEGQCELMKNVYDSCGLDPTELDYIEAHMTGTKVGDPVETDAIINAIRRMPEPKKKVKFGCLKSNMGHSEGASGVCSLSKVCKIFQTGFIPPNINYSTPNPNIKYLLDGTVIPVTSVMPFDGRFIGVDSFGFGGTNVHIILERNNKNFQPRSEDIMGGVGNLPRLIHLCNRTAEGINQIFEILSRTKLTREYLDLIQNVSNISKIGQLNGFYHRGYMIADHDPSTGKHRILQKFKSSFDKNNIWFVYSPLGCQWRSMGSVLMSFPIFCKLLDRLNIFSMHEWGIDLKNLLLNSEYNDIVSTLLSIITVQIGITDILYDLGIRPDGIIGHSIGEVGAAYADGCLDAEQALQMAYWIGKIGKESDAVPGQMAAVGLSAKRLAAMLPENISISARNSLDNTTISGDRDAVKAFVDELTSKGIFARLVDCNGIAYHCSMLESSRGKLTNAFVKIIPEPLKRTKWLSCAVPPQQYASTSYADAVYFTNMTINTVYFLDTMEYINLPQAIYYEVGPNSILQALIKRNAPKCHYVASMQRTSNKSPADEPNISLLASIGQLYCNGYNPDIKKLYPAIEYPVPRETPSLGHFIQWDHSISWKVTKYPEYFSSQGSDVKYHFDLANEQDRFLIGHVVDGRTLFPATGYLDIAWRKIANELGKQNPETIGIIFERVRFVRATILSPNSETALTVSYDGKTGKFCICEGGSVCVSGFAYLRNTSNNLKPNQLGQYLYHPERILTESSETPKSSGDDSTPSEFDANTKSAPLELSSKDIYRELRLRGYDYGLPFQGIVSAKSDGTHARVKYDRNWICFADSMLQVSIIGDSLRLLGVPTFIEYLECEPKLMQTVQDIASRNQTEAIFDVYFDKNLLITATKGLVIKGMKATPTLRRQNAQNPLREELLFMPFDCNIVQGTIELKNRQNYGELLRKAMTECPNIQDQEIRDIISRDRKDMSLLKILAENKLDELQERLATHRPIAAEDKLFTEGLDMLLRRHLDIVIENSATNKLAITEINTTSKLLHDDIISVINSNNIRGQFTLVHPDENVSRSTKTMQWPKDSDFSIMQLENNDLIVFKDNRTDFLADKYPNFEYDCLLNFAYKSLNKAGFLLLFYRTSLTDVELQIRSKLRLPEVEFDDLNSIDKMADENGFNHISRLTYGLWECLLLRKRMQNINDLAIKKIYPVTDNYEWVKEIRDSVSDKAIERIWLIANGPINGIIGLVNCLRKEPNGNRIRCYYSVDGESLSDPPESIVNRDLAICCSEKGVEGCFRYFTIAVQEPLIYSTNYYLDVKVRGDLSSLKWSQCCFDSWNDIPKSISNANVDIIDVYYSAINFKDIMVATGRVTLNAYPVRDNDPCLIGCEFSGIQRRTGKRVMAMVESHGIASSFLFDNLSFIFDVPDFWTLEQAATVPTVYLTVYYALIIRGRMTAGESILIHAGSGGVGQAAISICLARGVKVYTTVGTQAKRDYLKAKFPLLKDEDISNSRTAEFEERIMKQTNGRGVDIVLNSLAEDKFKASVRCLAPFGRFLEIGKYDIIQNNPLDPLDDNKQFHAVCLAHLTDEIRKDKIKSSAQNIRNQLVNLVSNGIKTGEVQPLDFTVFENNETEEAFRYMATGKHIGKVLIKLRDEKTLKAGQCVDRPLPIIAQTFFDPGKSYIVTGGLGGVGLELIYWMILRGALKIIITSRTGIRSNHQRVCLERFARFNRHKFNVNIRVLKNNGLTYEANEELINIANNIAPVGGVFHLSMVLHDAIMENQSSATYEKVCGPKINTAIYLDQITRQKCPELDYFVCFSSAASGKGNAGQTNYGFANSTLDRLCDQRQKDGLHGLSLQWGAIGDVGIVAELSGNDVVLGGTMPQRIVSCMETMDRFLQLSKNAINRKVFTFDTGGTRITSNFSVCASIVLADSKKSGLSGKDDLLFSICHVLGVTDHTTLDPNVTLSDLGLDSLMAVEIKQGLERDYDIVFSTQDIRNLRIRDICEISKRASTTKISTNSASTTALPMILNPDSIFMSISNHDGTPVFFLPPIEGDFSLMLPLSKYITRPVTGVNWTAEFDELQSIQQVAFILADKLRNHYPNLTVFDFVGYSFGGLLAIELCLRLKKLMGEDAVKTLVLLDTAPEYLKYQVSGLVKKFSVMDEEEALFESVLAYVTSFIAIENATEYKERLLALNMDERIEKLTNLIASKGIKCDPMELIAAAKRFGQKLRLAYIYRPSGELECDVKLLRCRDSLNVFNAIPDAQIEDDYGLGKLVKGKLDVIKYNGNHKTFLSQNSSDIGSFVDSQVDFFVA